MLMFDEYHYVKRNLIHKDVEICHANVTISPTYFYNELYSDIQSRSLEP